MFTLKFDPATLSIIINADILGNKPTSTRLVLDTGSSYVVLPWKLVNSIGIKIDPSKTVETTSVSMVENVPKITVPEIRVFGKAVKNVEAIVKDLPPNSPADGLLGLSFLKHFKLEIDFKNGYLSLE